MQFDPIGCVVLEFFGAVPDELLQVVRYNEGYSMSPRKEIGCEMRICDPGGRRQESRCSHHDSDSYQAAACESKDGSKEAVEETEADCAYGAAQDFADYGTEDHDSESDQEKGYDVSGCDVGDEAGKQRGKTVVVPAGQKDAGDEATQRKEFLQEATHEGEYGRAAEDDD